MARDERRKAEIFIRKRRHPFPLIQKLKRTDPIVPAEWNGENGTREIADLFADMVRMSRVLIDIVDDLRLAVTRDPTADPLVDADLEMFDRLGLAAYGSAEVKIARHFVGQQNRRSLCLDGAHRPREHAVEELILFNGSRRDMSDLEEDVELTDLSWELLLRVHQLD